jgi:hypothetical protein
MGKRKTLIPLSLTVLFILSCNLLTQQLAPQVTTAPTLMATIIIEPTTIVEPTSAPRSDLPRDEAAVPRISVEQAKTALDSGAAILVDVRSAQAYEQEHIPGAISIPLAEIETNPTGLKLEKDQWIITYCT